MGARGLCAGTVRRVVPIAARSWGGSRRLAPRVDLREHRRLCAHLAPPMRHESVPAYWNRSLSRGILSRGSLQEKSLGIDDVLKYRQCGARGRHGRITAARFSSIRGALMLDISSCLLFAYAHLQTCLRSSTPSPTCHLLAKFFFKSGSGARSGHYKQVFVTSGPHLKDLKDPLGPTRASKGY